MDIAYPTRSKFLVACESAIPEQRAKLGAGEVMHVDLHEGGYDDRRAPSAGRDGDKQIYKV
jgi:hypothetical protein